MPSALAAVLALTLLWAGAACESPSSATPAEPLVFAQGKHRGMSYAHAWRQADESGYGTSRSAESLARLREMGVNWISITPFGFQTTPHDTVVRGSRSENSETGDRLRTVTRQAHALGIRVMLKPHVWLRPPAWVGDVTHADEDDWAAWFASYRSFIVRYAVLAREMGVDAFSVGNEIEGTTHRDQDWRKVIGAVRAEYDGPLTYGANLDEVFTVGFWDALDFIGVSAYFPLVPGRAPDRDGLAAAWQPLIARLADLSGRWERRIVFTELGYRSADHAAWRQWEIGPDAPVNLTLQADAYAAFFDAVWPQSWFGGVYWWKWFSHLETGGPADNDYTPRGKPAEQVLASAYERAARGLTAER